MSDLRGRLTKALTKRYRIERELGSGGMAVVYLAEDLKHGRSVAVKVLRPELGHELGADRFLREIRIAAGLSHPNILPLFDSGEADGLLYFVMPYVDGETLRHRLDRDTTLPVEDVVRIIGEVGNALARAHEKGVVHRDIKPANILFESGHALVADFGVARAIDAAGGERLTRTGLAVGTPAYMSPEQVAGEASEDARSDVYSLGCLAYEMLAGEPPFTGSSAHAVVAGHIAKPVPSLRKRRPDVPAGLERAIERALAKEPSARFTTTTELVEAMTGAITAEAQRAEEGRAVRRRWTRSAAVLAVVAVVGGGGWWLTDSLSRPAIERLAVLPAVNITRDPEQDYFVDGVQEALVAELQRAGLSILARQSVLQYRDTDKTILQIAQELGVDALIQLTVGREGDDVVVAVSLLDGRSQLTLWTKSFDAPVEGLLALHRDVSRRIAAEIGRVLAPEAEARLAERPVVDPRALEAVMRGNVHLRTFTPQDLALALQYFESALEIDSLYALAHLGVGSVWGYRAQAGMIPAAEAGPVVQAHLAKALAIDPELPRARWVEAGNSVWRAWDFETGQIQMRRAIQLDPNDAEAQVFYGHLLMILGRWDEAVRQGELAMEIDPLNAFVTGLHGWLLESVGRRDEAIELLTDMLARNPAASFGRAHVANALHRAGRDEEAFALMRRDHASRFGPAVAEALDRGWGEGGFPGASKAAADVLAASGRSPWTIAQRYAAAGEVESAIDWLEIALEQRDQNMPYVGVISGFQELHDHPRFREVARRVGVRLLSPAG